MSAEVLTVPFKANGARRHHIPKQRHKVTNSAAYDAALRQRGRLTVWFTDTAIAAWKVEPWTTRGGQSHYSTLVITTALTLRAVFRLALRQTEGLIGSIFALLGLDLAVPDHSTLSRRAEMLEVALPLPGSAPMHLLVDSTGLKLCGAGGWLLEKHGTRTRRSWRKLHVGVDADTGQILAAVLTTNDVDDASQVSALTATLDAVQGVRTGGRGRPRKRPDKLHPDKGYDHRRCRRECRAREIKPRIARRGVESSAHLGRHRWVVERSFAWLARFRRLSIRYERRADLHLAFTTLACAVICMRQIRRLCP